MKRDRRQKRDVHTLDENGMVVCNPRDKEAAHRASVGDIVTAEPVNVTCLKCRDFLFRTEKRAMDGEELEKGYREMALDGNAEAEALEWIEGVAGDVGDEPW